MYLTIPKVLILGLLSSWFLGGSGNVIPVAPNLGNTIKESAAIRGHELISSRYVEEDIRRRATGGGGGGGRPHDTPGGPVSPGGHPDTPNGPSDQPSQTGEEGGFGDGEQGETEGGFCNKKRAWWLYWRRADCDAPGQNPNENPQGNNNPDSENQPNNYDPEDLTNRGRSATSGSEIPQNYRSNVLTVEQYTAKYKTEMKAQNIPEAGPWIFWSGKSGWSPNAFKRTMKDKKDKEVSWMRQLDPGWATDWRKWIDNVGRDTEWSYWAVTSTAFSKVVKGEVWVILPKGVPVNKPYTQTSAGSHWWSYEAPELTRSGQVDSILRIDMLPDGKFEVVGEIWKKGDPAWGFPGNEWQEPSLPDTPDFMPVPRDVGNPLEGIY